MSRDDATTLASAILVLILILAFMIWWIPQKWKACGNMYDNGVAQVICTLSK